MMNAPSEKAVGPKWAGASSFSRGLLLLLCLLGGCVRFQDKPLSPEKTAAELRGRNLQEPELRDYLQTNLVQKLEEWPLKQWSLLHLALAACYYNPELELARRQWATVEAGRVTAGQRPNPTLSVTPGYNTTTHIPSPWIVTPTLDVPLETAGKRGHRINEALQLGEAARLNAVTVAWRLRGQVRQSLVELRAAEETAMLLTQQQKLNADNVRLLEQQHQIGSISAFEVAQARLASTSSALAAHDAQRRRADARAALAEAIGIPAVVLDEIKISYQELDEMPSDLASEEARRRALLSRSDLLSALASYAASQAALQLEIANQYPDVHLNPGYEFDQGDNKWSLGLSVTLPILNRNEGGIAEAEAHRSEAAASFLALQAKVLAETDRAVELWRVALQKQSDAEALLADLKRQQEAAQVRLDIGDIARSELVALQLQWAVSALAGAEARADVSRAYGQLEQALQSSFRVPPELETQRDL